LKVSPYGFALRLQQTDGSRRALHRVKISLSIIGESSYAMGIGEMGIGEIDGGVSVFLNLHNLAELSLRCQKAAIRSRDYTVSTVAGLSSDEPWMDAAPTILKLVRI